MHPTFKITAYSNKLHKKIKQFNLTYCLKNKLYIRRSYHNYFFNRTYGSDYFTNSTFKTPFNMSFSFATIGNYSNVHLTSPLLAGLEFMTRPVLLPADLQEDFEMLIRFHKKQQWQFDITRLSDFLRNPKHTIVLTDPLQHIQWVNKGFRSMTGYEAKEVLHKRPSFLQGPNTDLVLRQEIRNCLYNKQTFDGNIVNYRKNGDTYLCCVRIEPIFNREKELTNFIAFEYEVA